MRALTVKQPWATLIVMGVKRIENRGYVPPRAIANGERFAIHAGKGWDDSYGRRCARRFDRDELPSGVVVCTARISRVVTESDDRYFVGPFGWVLDDVRPASSGVLRGQLGLWEVSDRLIRHLS